MDGSPPYFTALIFTNQCLVEVCQISFKRKCSHLEDGSHGQYVEEKKPDTEVHTVQFHLHKVQK